MDVTQTQVKPQAIAPQETSANHSEPSIKFTPSPFLPSVLKIKKANTQTVSVKVQVGCAVDQPRESLSSRVPKRTPKKSSVESDIEV